MTNFQPASILLRSHPLFDVAQEGPRARVIAKSPRVKADGFATIHIIADIKAVPQHFAMAVIPALEKAGYAAFVIATIDGKTAQIGLTADQFAAGASERSRYADWAAGVTAWRNDQAAAAHDFDARHNEGGEGYNPFRRG